VRRSRVSARGDLRSDDDRRVRDDRSHQSQRSDAGPRRPVARWRAARRPNLRRPARPLPTDRRACGRRELSGPRHRHVVGQRQVRFAHACAPDDGAQRRRDAQQQRPARGDRPAEVTNASRDGRHRAFSQRRGTGTGGRRCPDTMARRSASSNIAWTASARTRTSTTRSSRCESCGRGLVGSCTRFQLLAGNRDWEGRFVGPEPRQLEPTDGLVSTDRCVKGVQEGWPVAYTRHLLNCPITPSGGSQTSLLGLGGVASP
jgi:hypothetical protein